MFARTRIAAIFKKRAARKKAQPKLTAARAFEAARIQQIRQVKAGARRASTMRYNPAIEAQLRQVSS